MPRKGYRPTKAAKPKTDAEKRVHAYVFQCKRSDPYAITAPVDPSAKCGHGWDAVDEGRSRHTRYEHDYIDF